MWRKTGRKTVKELMINDIIKEVSFVFRVNVIVVCIEVSKI